MKGPLSVLLALALAIPNIVVTAPIASAAPTAPKILVLGDSYISGNGSRDEDNNRT